ncbi:MAG: hypothetical protein AB7V56_05035 [Candidatus Nitrosocosmicus sp.]
MSYKYVLSKGFASHCLIKTNLRWNLFTISLNPMWSNILERFPEQLTVRFSAYPIESVLQDVPYFPSTSSLFSPQLGH